MVFTDYRFNFNGYSGPKSRFQIYIYPFRPKIKDDKSMNGWLIFCFGGIIDFCLNISG
jgi:hypothetical protein